MSVDDGTACHLLDRKLPGTPLTATNGHAVDLSALAGRTVVYAYPRAGQPGVANPDGWDDIPGARGCTPQSCACRDHAAALKALGVRQRFGLSTQDTAYQAEAAARLHLPFPLLSDSALLLTRLLDLPTVEVAGMILVRRLTLIVGDGVITHLFYPVFPPDCSASDVLEWLRAGAKVEPAGYEVEHSAHGPSTSPGNLDASS
jgi:peroxiredoxin